MLYEISVVLFMVMLLLLSLNAGLAGMHYANGYLRGFQRSYITICLVILIMVGWRNFLVRTEEILAITQGELHETMTKCNLIRPI